MRVALFLLLSSGCASSGAIDAGTTFCLAAADCDVIGTWHVGYTLLEKDDGSRCIPPTEPLRLVPDGTRVCMPGASSGGSYGCSFHFDVVRNDLDWAGNERWNFVADAGVLTGDLSIRMTFPPCYAKYSLAAAR
jgi:hypothetical protein